MTTYVFVTGMFRSGTTLLSMMLNNHPAVCCANDPYLPVFKAFRNAVERRIDGPDQGSVEANRPLDDYYFRPHVQALMTAIQSTGLELEAEPADVASVRQGVAGYAEEFSPRIARLANRIGGRTFRDIMARAFDICGEAYGAGAEEVVGFKTPWADEFIPHVLNAFPEARVIQIVRDPRAVAASKNARGEKYPWLFLARQWRKLATFAWNNRRPGNPLRDRIHVVSYEALIADPVAEAQAICSFLGIPFDGVMVEAGEFTTGDGEAWQANSSHFVNVSAFNPESIDRWRRTLSTGETRFIEYLCLPEMRAMGYTPEAAADGAFPGDLIFSPPEVPQQDLARWIRPYAGLEPYARLSELSMEAARHASLDGGVSPDKQVKRMLYLLPEFHDHAREVS